MFTSAPQLERDPLGRPETRPLHENAGHLEHDAPFAQQASPGRLATSATLHCLAGCGLGEIAGDAVGTGLNLSNGATVGLGLLFGLIVGFALGILPFRRQGLPFGTAARLVLIAEGLSIAVMEAAEASVEVFVPGLMAATLTQTFYWIGMMGALTAGFVVAWPINYVLVLRGVTHHH